MYLIVEKTHKICGEITLSGSKSQTIRAMLFALLAQGESTLSNVLNSDDTQDAANICKQMGARINVSLGNKLRVTSTGFPFDISTNTIYSGNSGITTCFIMPMLGLRKNPVKPVILDCGEQMRARPIASLVAALNCLGLTVTYVNNTGLLPVAISGSLKGGKAEVSGITSQFLSALLISLPCAQARSEIMVKDLHEHPYVAMTLEWLRQQKIDFSHQPKNNEDRFLIKGGQKYRNFDTLISGDFSSASYFIVAAAMLNQSCVKLLGLNIKDKQGDQQLISILQQMGADIIVQSEQLIIHGGKELQGMRIDASNIPDLVPTLAVIGTYAEGKTEIVNVRQARLKETDRIHSMTEGLRRMGAKIVEQEDGLTVYQSQLQGAQVKGYNDHRTVMALAIAGMLAEGITAIDDAEAINKTFPEFVVTLQSLKIKAEITNERP